MVAAGLNRYIKQMSSNVTESQFRELTAKLNTAFNNALTITPSSVTTNVAGLAPITFDAEKIKATLTAQLPQLMRDIQQEFQQTGKVTRPDMTNLVTQWFGGISTAQAKQIIDQNDALFKHLQESMDEFMAYTETAYDKYERMAKALTDETKKIQEDAVKAMTDTISFQKNRLSTLFESTFLNTGFTDAVRGGLDQLITGVERLARTITNILGGALKVLGLGDIQKGGY